ncbi:MAG: hypothetical protein IKN41_00620 [Candidatus Methanomethylophilaceae archaeon]|nr:hypothetical protein [Candidatus Methanomethylophilaceae archaeon]MBR6910344.1 hypothetical protein [Candidatus Methanomethylophilaceae archaeon]
MVLGGIGTDTRKLVLIATIAAIALVAVGIGYAYTASTQNTENTANSEYITLVQDGDGAYSFEHFSKNTKVYWNSMDSRIGSKPAIVYTNPAMIQGTASHMTDCYIMQLGKPFKILTEGNGTTSSPLECSIFKGGEWEVFTGGDHPTTYFLKVENSTTTWFKFVKDEWERTTFEKYGTDGWNGGSIFNIEYDSVHGKYYDTTVTVYYAIDGGNSISVEHEPGVQPAGPALPANGVLLAGASLTFTVTKA